MTAINWNSTVHLEVKKALEKDIIPIITHIYARIIHFEQDFVKEAAEFLGDYKSLEKEADVKADLLKRLVLLQKDFEKLEAHNISLELQFLNQSLALGPSEFFLKESSDVANVKKDIDDIETINSELEHNVRIRATRLQDLVDQAFASCPLADHDKQSKEIESKP
ncbi:hypothetical protein Tco_0434776 [Tanacetum coccineum]